MTFCRHELEIAFKDSVKYLFGYLHDFGFVIETFVPDRVCYVSPQMIVTVYYEILSNEIALTISNPAGMDSFSMSEIIGLYNWNEGLKYRDYATSTPSGIRKGVSELAAKFFVLIKQGLLKNENLFSDLAKLGEKKKKIMACDSQLKVALERSMKAWEDKDYTRFVSILKPYRSFLCEADMRKYLFADKKMRLL